jgi:hypothetical protein
MEIIINQHVYEAIQIGTVMTDPEYRSQGLSKRLMDMVIDEYRTKCSFFYLYANKSVLNFYPKLGFIQAPEPSYSFDLNPAITNKLKIRKLNIHSDPDWSLLLKLYASRKPTSSHCGVRNAEGILTWYCLNVFNDDIYVLEDLSTIVIYTQKDHILHLYDIISTQEDNLIELIERLPLQGVNKVEVHYEPEPQSPHIAKTYIKLDDTRFVYPINDNISLDLKFPQISKA